jgi:hypothetical protein
VSENQKTLNQARSAIELVAADLRGAIELGIPLWDDEVLGLCDQLEMASIMIRVAGGDLT